MINILRLVRVIPFKDAVEVKLMLASSHLQGNTRNEIEGTSMKDKHINTMHID
jgi:hypothetical protein